MPDTEFLDTNDFDEFDKAFDSQVVKSKYARKDNDSGKSFLVLVVK